MKDDLLTPFDTGLSVSSPNKTRPLRSAILPANRKRHFDTSQGTEELAHLEMIGSMVHQLMDKVPAKELEKLHVDTVYAIHGRGIHPSDSNGVPFTAAYLESMEDPIANLTEDMAAEQKARATYEYLINMAEDPDVLDPLRFLREREVVHFQRFGEVLRVVQEQQQGKKYF